MKSRLLILLCALLPMLGVAQEKTTLERFLQKMDQTTFRAKITLTIAEDAAHPQTHTGRVAMCGRMFYIHLFQTEASYDGKTFYVYSPETKELSMSAPTEEELLESNPLLYARELSKVCKVSEKATNAGNTIITLVPKDQSKGVQRFELTVKTATLMPVSLEVKEGASYTRITFREGKFSDDKPVFVMQRKGATVIDLR
ncbi:MAG: outer membrane lipoprotein carrier protein LolA [Paludibacteraceae bacterium]|nr:outer membrane lipoprotein carrier protein LolA [Paludibacteraceae bacterium]